jgi:predicted RNA binding protein YcfA (HicA-like mRNA interferase family)
MPRLGPITRRELVRRLRQLGFRGPFAGGRHQFMAKGSVRVRLPNPHREDLGQHLLRHMLREAGLEISAWEGL